MTSAIAAILSALFIAAVACALCKAASSTRWYFCGSCLHYRNDEAMRTKMPPVASNVPERECEVCRFGRSFSRVEESLMSGQQKRRIDLNQGAAMTPEAQNIAIRDAMGGDNVLFYAPNYVGDLNLMHEVEKTLVDYKIRNDYTSELAAVLVAELLREDPGCIPDCMGFEWIHASAAQRSEAFLKTIGKWVEEKGEK